MAAFAVAKIVSLSPLTATTYTLYFEGYIADASTSHAFQQLGITIDGAVDTDTTIRAAISSAIVAYALANLGIVIAATDTLIPDMVRV